MVRSSNAVGPVQCVVSGPFDSTLALGMQRPLLLFLLLVLRGLLLLLGLLILWNLLLRLRLLVLRGLLLVRLVLRGCLIGLICRGLLLGRSTEEAREETQLRKQNQDQQDHYHDQKANYQPGGSATSVCPPSAFFVHSSILDDREEDRNHGAGSAGAGRDLARKRDGAAGLVRAGGRRRSRLDQHR